MDAEAKYLTYTPWQGDLNNTRMCLETVLIFAFLSKRIFVPSRDYRLQDQPEWEGRKWKPLHPQEWLDWETLSAKIAVLPYEKYFHDTNGGHQIDQVDLVFSPSTTVFCFPKVPPPNSTQAERLRHFAAGRSRFLDFTDKMRECHTLNVKSPTLEHFYSFFYFCNREDEIASKRLIKDHVTFRADIVATANQIAERLGPYCAVHVRRNDFVSQFPDLNLPATQILDNVMARVPAKTRLYIATDEPNKHFFSVFQAHYEVRFLRDFQDLIKTGMSPASLACVEQMICAFARVFISTRLSTFSGYITRLRGYYGAPDKQIYFTDGSPGSEMDSQGAPPFSWINWVNGGNPLWGREYKEAWEF